jgi:hypothetical protein
MFCFVAPIAGFEEDEEIDETSMRHLATDDEIAAVEADDDNDMENDEDLDDDGGVSDEELTKSVFEDLANGKKVVTVKDLMGWDIVLDLMGEVRSAKLDGVPLLYVMQDVLPADRIIST